MRLQSSLLTPEFIEYVLNEPFFLRLTVKFNCLQLLFFSSLGEPFYCFGIVNRYS